MQLRRWVKHSQIDAKSDQFQLNHSIQSIRQAGGREIDECIIGILRRHPRPLQLDLRPISQPAGLFDFTGQTPQVNRPDPPLLDMGIQVVTPLGVATPIRLGKF